MSPERCKLAMEAMVRWKVSAIPVNGAWWPDYANTTDEIYDAASEAYDRQPEAGHPDPVTALLAIDDVLRAYDGGRLLKEAG